ncbi:MAG TPA: DUF2254 domain-containing protein [Pedococcus sp.]|jgi:uncharacterized membrane protein|nr:DUF2254 domain-containing protein [Pedococcus sp.]
MRREAAREYLRGALWAMPSVAVVAALIAGSVLSSITIAPGSALAPLVFQGTADDARNLLIGIASTMVTVIALVLGLTVVALQLASTQFSPRLLRNFLRDLTNQLTLSSFVATFAYSTAGLYTVGVSGGERTSDYPRLAVSGALLLIFVSMIMLVFFVHHLAHSIQVDQVMVGVEQDTLHVIEHSMGAVAAPGALPARPEGAVPMAAPRSGYVQTLHLQALAATAAQHRTVVVLVPMVGEHVVKGAPLAWVWPDQANCSVATAPGQPTLDALRGALSHGVRLGFERTAEQDAAFGVRQLADVASKALSPAINDPYTAVQAVDHLSVVLASLAQRTLGPVTVTDASGVPRVHVPARDWEYFVDLGLGQVRRYGHTEPRVVLALFRVARDIATFCDSEQRAAVRRYVEVLLDDVGRDIVQPADRDPLLERGRALLLELRVGGLPAPTG